MRDFAGTKTVLIALFGAISLDALSADAWQLMARHGECYPIKSLERKLPDLGNVSDPEAFIDFIKAKGLAVSSRPLDLQGSRAVEVLVPGKELSLVFVTAASCREMVAR